jgi:hypothetical protein
MNVLAQVIANLAEDRVQWLQVDTWQKMFQGEHAYEADGRLVLGPNQCARWELSVKASRSRASWLVVSDGRGAAQRLQIGSRPPQVETRLLPELEGAGMVARMRARTQALQEKGCASPVALLRGLKGSIAELHGQTGVWKETPVIRLEGVMHRDHFPPGLSALRPDLPHRACRLYLDACSLWPHRVEWWAAAVPGADAILLSAMEFRNPQINQPLPLEQCAREFSFPEAR